MPRFQSPNFEKNLLLLAQIAATAKDQQCSVAQLALAWLLSRGEHVLPIPGTTSVEHLQANVAAADIQLDASVVEHLDRIINQHTVNGPRYPSGTQAEIDTEEFG